MSIADVEAAAFALPADLGIEHAGALRERLFELFERPALTIDAGAVARMHGATLQLLAAFCRDRQAAGRVTRWSGAGAVPRDAAQRLGLAAQLQIGEH